MMRTLFDNVARKVEQEHIYTVTELANHVESAIKEKFSSTIRIKGEISGLKIHANGHIYFTLKDDKSVLYAVCWKSVKLRFKLEDGMNIIANGLIKVYKERSQYQIDVREVDIAGEGEWFRIIHERSKMFETRGYFKNKRPLPKYPGIIGIVTSPTGAVIRDMEHRLLDRYPACKVFVYPANVQGNTAAQQIANGIQFFNTSIIKPDVIIVARGGGSVEDLLPFSEEVVVRSIYESKIPVISAIGHETDTTLADYAADVRAPTPTAAIEFATPVLSEMVLSINTYKDRICQALQQIVLNFTVRMQSIDKFMQCYHEFCINMQSLIENYSNKSLILIKNIINEYVICINSIHIIPPNFQIKEQLLHNNSDKLLNVMNIIINNKIKDVKSVRMTSLTQYLQTKIQLYQNNSNIFFKNYVIYIKYYSDYLSTLNNRLEQSSYLTILSKGFCYAYDKNGVIRKKSDIHNSKFELRFCDGNVAVQTTNT